MSTPRIDRYLVYGLKDPITNRIRYVGKSSNYLYRPKEHLRDRNWNGPLKNTYLYRWIKKLNTKGLLPEIITLESTNDGSRLALLERNWIAKLRKQGNRLCNLTEGGEGCSGRKVSKETKDKIRKAHFGRKLSESWRRNLSIAHKGLPSNRKGKKCSDETKKLISKNSTIKKKVICIETGQVWESASSLVSELKCSKSYLLKHINGKKNGRRSYASMRGLHYKYLEVQ